MSPGFINTGVICLVCINVAGDTRQVDLGNYYTAPDGSRCLITSKALAAQYGHLVSYPVYTFK